MSIIFPLIDSIVILLISSTASIVKKHKLFWFTTKLNKSHIRQKSIYQEQEPSLHAKADYSRSENEYKGIPYYDYSEKRIITFPAAGSLLSAQVEGLQEFLQP